MGTKTVTVTGFPKYPFEDYWLKILMDAADLFKQQKISLAIEVLKFHSLFLGARWLKVFEKKLDEMSETITKNANKRYLECRSAGRTEEQCRAERDAEALKWLYGAYLYAYSYVLEKMGVTYFKPPVKDMK